MRLPIHDMEKEIIKTISQNRTIVLTGATGCGKSTQLPLMLFKNFKTSKKIICTQPRRVACINIANRVASELKSQVGDLVGYHIGKSPFYNKNTRIIFVTTGIMLNYLIHKTYMLENFDFVILDEVHERDVDMDFVFMILKTLMCQFLHLKIVMMSATIEANLMASYFCPKEITYERVSDLVNFSEEYIKNFYENEDYRDEDDDYFRLQNLRRKNGWVVRDFKKENFVKKKEEKDFHNLKRFLGSPSPILEIRTKSKFKIETFFLDSLEKFCGFQSAILKKYKNERLYKKKALLIEEFLILSLDLIEHILKQKETSPPYGRFLIFLPGLNEIIYFSNLLSKRLKKTKLKNYQITQIHSKIIDPNNLNNLQKNKIYFLIATNIAESSITIPDIRYIIDFCLVKEQVVRKNRNSFLGLCWSSKASCLQRKGRTGRCNNGYSFLMVGKKFYDNLNEMIHPEILRVPLDKIVLKMNIIYETIKKNNLRKNKFELTAKIFANPFRSFNLCIEVVKKAKILDSVNFLINTKAMKEIKNGEKKYENTFLGNLYSGLPCSIGLVKLIVYGRSMDCLEDNLIISGILNSRKNMFCSIKSLTNDQIDIYYETLKKFSDDENSDLILYLNLYKEWSKVMNLKNMRYNNLGKAKFLLHRKYRDSFDIRDWTKKNFLNKNGMIEIFEQIETIKQQILRVEKDFFNKKFFEKINQGCSKTDYYKRMKISFVFAFFPNILKIEKENNRLNQKDAEYLKTLKINSENTIKIQNPPLKIFLEEKRNFYDNVDIDRALDTYEKILRQRFYVYKDQIKTTLLDNYDYFIEFKKEKAYDLIKEILFKDKFYKKEKYSLRIFSFEAGIHSKMFDEKLTDSEIKKEQYKSENNKIKKKEEIVRSNIPLEEIEQLLESIQLKYLNPILIEDILSYKSISIISTSFNKNIILPKKKKELFIVSNNVFEGNSKRYYASDVSLLPYYDSFFETFLFFFSDKKKWKMNKFGIVENIKFNGLDHELKFWYDREDMKELELLIQKINVSLIIFIPIIDDELVGSMINFLKKKRKKFFFREKWLDSYKFEEEEEEGKKNYEKISDVENLYDKYLSWKKNEVSKLEKIKLIINIKKARICCNICKGRLFDLEYLATEKKELYREINAKNLFLKKVKKNEYRCPEKIKDFFKTYNNFGITFDFIYKCYSDHLIAIGILKNEKEKIFLPNFVNVFILYPDSNTESYNNHTFNKDLIIMKEEKAIFFRDKMIKEFECKICEPGKFFKNGNDVYKHLNSKDHGEQVKGFRDIIS